VNRIGYHNAQGDGMRKIMMTRRVSHFWGSALILFFLLFPTSSFSASLLFDQLNWIGTTTQTPDSSWGRVTVDFTGLSTREYFNLNVNGNWVVRNMGIDSLQGTGLGQKVTTTFDLGVSNGIDVTNIAYTSSFNAAPLTSIPTGPLASATVNSLNYQIGGEAGVDLGSPGTPPSPVGGNANTPVDSAKLPNLDKFQNQVQGPNECAPGAISNSLKYLQATGQLNAGVGTNISDIKPIVSWATSGAPSNWPMLKRDHFGGMLVTTFIDPTDIDELIKAINAGKDVELDLQGHVAAIAGVRRYSDGRVELDIFDDNQTDNTVDPLRTVEIRNGKVDGMGIDRYVVESAVPEPSTMILTFSGIIILAGSRLARHCLEGLKT